MMTVYMHHAEAPWYERHCGRAEEDEIHRRFGNPSPVMIIVKMILMMSMMNLVTR